MKNCLVCIASLFYLTGCVHEHQINICDISLSNHLTAPLKHKEYYMSVTQEYYDNKLYPINQYCDDQRSYLSNDKFSTETYLKISNERTKQSRVGKYPIWFLLNDDASNISCVYKSANFINSEPFIVNDTDRLSVNLLQKNEAATKVPVQELGILIDFVSLLVPRTANFLMHTNNIIKDPRTRNYLNLMDESFKNGDLDGTKNREFTTETASIKVKLQVPQKDKIRELGYILLKPKYRTTLSTVELNRDIPNFRFIYDSSDPRIEDLMNYELKGRKVPLKVMVDNFKQVSSGHIVEALASLNTQLMNHFTSYDRALILSLALRQSDLYKQLSTAISTQNAKVVATQIKVLMHRDNPLNSLLNELKVTKCEYYEFMHKSQALVKKSNLLFEEAEERAKRMKEEKQRYLRESLVIENFLVPVTNWNYLPQMFTGSIKIFKTTGEELLLPELLERYNRKEKITEYGCYVDLQRKIEGISVQEYLIHTNYSRGINYNYMALSVDKLNRVDVIFYKFNKGKPLQIDKMLIDSENRFISKSRIKKLLDMMNPPNCSNNIRRLF